MKNIIQGEDKAITVKVTDSNGDALDLTLFEKIKACLPSADGGHVYKMLMTITGTTVSASDIITITDEDIVEGQPISGAGIPANSTVLKTPTSETSPSAAGTIKISHAATASATVALTFGDAVISATLGKVTFNYSESDTALLKVGANSLEVKLVKSGVTKFLQFPNEFNVLAQLCS